MHNRLSWLGLFVVLASPAAELKFDFGAFPEGQMPPGFRSAVTGEGKRGEWKTVLVDVPPLLEPLSPKPADAPSTTKRAVLAQVSQDPTDEHFPLLIYEGETFGDFTFTTRFKTVGGKVEQMAGIAFRIQDEKNYYVLRASSLGNTFRFYRVLNGERGNIVGPATIPIPSGEWHEMSVETKGNEFRCFLDGKQIIPTHLTGEHLTDNAFTKGKIGFWTKSDSVSYFDSAKLVYIHAEAPARAIVRSMLKKYPRLLGMKIYVAGGQPGTTRLVASQDEKELGNPGSKTEQEVIGRGETYYGKEKESVSVIMPLRDRNGDAIAAVRVIMKPFPGQTEENALIRAAPLVKEIQAQVQSLEDLTD
jgi:hypothetical protein